MSLPDTAQVLIVGGGPTGLVLALALQKHGCPDVVVVDAISQGENTSRALVVHAATIEAFDDIGVADLLLKEGRQVSKTMIWLGRGVPVESAYFTPLSKYTKFPFILAVPQHVTEKVLGSVAQERGICVHRPHKVVDMKPNAENNTLTDVTFDDGHILRTRCVVGADGARSTVRRLAHVAWADPTGEADANSGDEALANMIVADITLSTPPPFQVDLINLCVSNENAFLFIALPGTPYPDKTTEQTYRIACAIPLSFGIPPSSPDTAYVQKLLDAWGPNVVLPADTPRIQVTSTVWSSRFRTHSAVAENFFTHVPLATSTPGHQALLGGPVCLIGDAAHIHPPVGGQGMNLGVRDAVRLAPILTEYVQTAAGTPGLGSVSRGLESPLRAWAAERRERALKVIAMVKGLQRMAWIQNERKWLLGIIPYNLASLRNAFMRFVTMFEWFRANNAWRLSGLGNP